MAVDGVNNTGGAKGASPSGKVAERKKEPGAETAHPMRGGESARKSQEKNSEGPGKAHSGGVGGNVDIKA